MLPPPRQAPKKAKKRIEGANSNVFSMFEQTQIQEFKEVGAAVESPVWRQTPPAPEFGSTLPSSVSPAGTSGVDAFILRTTPDSVCTCQ